MAKSSETHRRPLVFGVVAGNQIVLNYPTGASETWYEFGGRWATHDSDAGRLIAAGAATTVIDGWVLKGGDTATSSTEEATRVNIDIAFDTLYEMPIDAAQTPAALLDLMWESCDIVVDTYQYADLDASTTDVLQLVDYRAYNSGSSADNTVIVRRHINRTSANIFVAQCVA